MLELPSGERNFHIFYYLMAGASPEEPATSRRQNYARDASPISLVHPTPLGSSLLLFSTYMTSAQVVIYKLESCHKCEMKQCFEQPTLVHPRACSRATA